MNDIVAGVRQYTAESSLPLFIRVDEDMTSTNGFHVVSPVCVKFGVELVYLNINFNFSVLDISVGFGGNRRYPTS